MKFIIVFSILTTLVLGEPPLPSPYGRIALRLPQNVDSNSESARIVDQNLLNRVADILSAGGDGEEQENEGMNLVDSDLFERIARIISQNDGQVKGLGKSSVPTPTESQPTPEASVPGDLYGAPSSNYGVPSPQEVQKLTGVGNIELGQPIPSRRLASFDIHDEPSGYANSQQQQQSGYSNPNSFSLPLSSNGGGRFQFISEPQTAERIAAFDIPDSPAPQVQEGYSQ